VKQRALVLGASGFIGINLVGRLVQSGFHVTCVARHLSAHWPKEARPLLVDLREKSDAVVDAMRGALVFHLASDTRPSKDSARVSTELANDLFPVLHYLEASREIDCRWIFASSGGTVYGQSTTDSISETHQTEPISAYGVSKLAAEGYFRVYGTLFDTEYCIARISNPYGPHQDPAKGQGLIAMLIDRMMRGELIEIWGDGENTRDYIYVSDVADALLKIAQRGTSARTYNVGSGVGRTINGLIEEVSKHLDAIPRVAYRPARGIDVRQNVLCTDRIAGDLQWSPQVSFGRGIGFTRRWLEEQALHRRSSASA
jgi:UDP-glucose 4-epimerase